MQLETFTFSSHRAEIYGSISHPSDAKAVLVLVHGLGEHSGRYQDQLVPTLLSDSLAVLMYDNIGHGRSGGKRGHCPSYEALLDILEEAIKKAVAVYPGLPLFLYGHSMGGNLVLNYVLRRPHTVHGVIATSPYLRLAFKPPKWKMLLGRLFLHIAPAIVLPSGLDSKGISRIPREVEKYEQDPLVHDLVSPVYSFPVMDAGSWAIANAHKLAVDTLLLHGTADPIIDYTGTVEFHENSNSSTLHLLEGGFHELHHDLCGPELLKLLQGWILSKL